MYSVVLMMALTSGGDTPDLGHRGGGCRGGGGGCYGSCYGGGGGCHGGGRKHGRRGGGGGCCGCYGGGYGGCYGGGYGGCYGGGMGYGYGGCYGGMGMGYGGCYGGAIMGGGCYGGGIQTMPGTGTAPEKIKKTPKQKGDTTQAGPASATIVVSLPADAKLLIDNEATTSTGDSRVFVSPTLNPGREYHYTLKAQAVRDGKTVTAERVITVRAGETTPASLTLPATRVAQR